MASTFSSAFHGQPLVQFKPAYTATPSFSPVGLARLLVPSEAGGWKGRVGWESGGGIRSGLSRV